MAWQETDTNPLYLGLDEFTNNLIVEVVDGCPFDALLHILFLLSLQRQLNENLLQLLIHKVDAKLLKPIFLKSSNMTSLRLL